MLHVDVCVQIITRAMGAVHDVAKQHHKAFYSSVFGGITTNPAMMTVPMDDHMVHRGHGVFDTAIVSAGCAYQLDQHIARLRRSAKIARITVPFSDRKIRRVLLDTAAYGRTPFGAHSHCLLSQLVSADAPGGKSICCCA